MDICKIIRQISICLIFTTSLLTIFFIPFWLMYGYLPFLLDKPATVSDIMLFILILLGYVVIACNIMLLVDDYNQLPVQHNSYTYYGTLNNYERSISIMSAPVAVLTP